MAGENDTLVKFEWQQRSMETVRKLNGCEAKGEPWAKECVLYPSKTGTPFVAWIHPGAHVVPPGAPEVVVRFFKQHPEGRQ
jgi:polyhydroxybutyrate depolymerase